jgi:hypothetical protein
MSLDYPLYEEMKRRKCTRGGRLWMLGDRLYYAGLLGGVVGAPMAATFCFMKFGQMRLVFMGACGVFILGAGAFCLGGFLKTLSYKEAEKCGIDPADIIGRGSEEIRE